MGRKRAKIFNEIMRIVGKMKTMIFEVFFFLCLFFDSFCIGTAIAMSLMDGWMDECILFIENWCFEKSAARFNQICPDFFSLLHRWLPYVDWNGNMEPRSMQTTKYIQFVVHVQFMKCAHKFLCIFFPSPQFWFNQWMPCIRA